jgi:threonine aldolase
MANEQPFDSFQRGFASDNFAGVHPRVLEKLLACNHGHELGVHMDGARIGCAVASLGTTFREMAAS